MRGGIPRRIGDFLDTLSQAMLVGVMLVGRLGVWGVDYDFINYNLNQNLEFQTEPLNFTPLARFVK